MKRIAATPLALIVPLALLVSGCSESSSSEAAPTSAPLEAPAEVAEGGLGFAIDRPLSEVDFLMEAPLENIHGVANGSVEGTLNVNLSDLAQSSGLLRIDLDRLEVLQRKRETEDEELGEEVRSQRQNDHMRTWLQISEDGPAELRERNRWVEFRADRLTDLSDSNVLSMQGAERTVRATIHGDLRLHERTTHAMAQVELTFVFDGDSAAELRVRSLTPMLVSLEAHDVRPRRAFDQLAQKTLAAVGEKVADTAPVMIRFTARPAD